MWNRPIFSFLKKVSGIQTLLASVMVRYLILPKLESTFKSDFSGHKTLKIYWTATARPGKCFEPKLCKLDFEHFLRRAVPKFKSDILNSTFRREERGKEDVIVNI